MYTYLIKSKNLSETDIKKAFNQRSNWKPFDESTSGNPDFLYVDNVYASFDKSLYKYKMKFKNMVDRESKAIITDKQLSYDALTKLNDSRINKYLINQEVVVLEDIMKGKNNINNYRKYFHNNGVIIFKILKGSAGQNIYVFDNFDDFRKFCYTTITKYHHKWNNKKLQEMRMGNIHTSNKWILQKYITNPLLFKGKKFHLRTYFLYYKNTDKNTQQVVKNAYLFKLANIWTAKEEYKNKDYYNNYIHDSRGRNTDKAYFFPYDFTEAYGKENTQKVLKGLIDIHSYLYYILDTKCYSESDNCYEIFGGDVMITDKMEVKFIEVNSNFGALQLPGNNKNYMYHIFNESLSLTVDTILKPETEPKTYNMFIELPEYHKRTTRKTNKTKTIKKTKKKVLR